ncbi:hypothetical protein NOR51B_663 [Luminiphilus syltensis NOR5-1B]|uniref:Uncharacterized protein n=1 Tax=Luminiphilus syltensis NOR5-1B TaxID=565045 RepID=B8KW53_9GAMM|nr:hypothetical protein NOR51B_663 [Luminiphilus syltensis NOR5-1B]
MIACKPKEPNMLANFVDHVRRNYRLHDFFRSRVDTDVEQGLTTGNPKKM